VGGDINAVNDSGKTVIHGATAVQSLELIEFLVERGARVDIEDRDGQTPVDLAEIIRSNLPVVAEAAVMARQRELATKIIERLSKLSGEAKAPSAGPGR